MKKLLCSLVLMAPMFLMANQKTVEKQLEEKTVWETKFNGVAYLPAGEELSGIYGKAWKGMRFEVSRTFNKKLGLQYWASGDFVGAQGNTKLTNTKTKMNLYPIGMGVKMKRNFGSIIDCYTGGGPRYARMIILSKTNEVSDRLDRNGYGATIFSGASIKIFDSLALNGQFDYSLLYFGEKELANNKEEKSVVASTITLGTGLKFKF